MFDTSILWISGLYLAFEGAKKIIFLQVLIWGFGGRWRFPTGILHPDINLDMVTGIWFTHFPMFGSLSWFWRCKEHPCPLSPNLGLWRMLGIPDFGLWWGLILSIDIHWMFLSGVYHHDHDLDMVTGLWYTSSSILKVQRTSLSFKSLFRDLEEAGGSWLGFGILILIWIWSLVFDILMIQISVLYLDFEGAKNIHVLQFLIWGFGGRWRFQTGVWHHELYLDMVKNLTWIFPEVLITLRSVEDQIQSV